MLLTRVVFVTHDRPRWISTLAAVQTAVESYLPVPLSQCPDFGAPDPLVVVPENELCAIRDAGMKAAGVSLKARSARFGMACEDYLTVDAEADTTTLVRGVMAYGTHWQWSGYFQSMIIVTDSTVIKAITGLGDCDACAGDFHDGSFKPTNVMRLPDTLPEAECVFPNPELCWWQRVNV